MRGLRDDQGSGSKHAVEPLEPTEGPSEREVEDHVRQVGGGAVLVEQFGAPQGVLDEPFGCDAVMRVPTLLLAMTWPPRSSRGPSSRPCGSR
jgi:hypothetical protein